MAITIKEFVGYDLKSETTKNVKKNNDKSCSKVKNKNAKERSKK